MGDNKKTTSIARKINFSMWSKRFWGIVGLDILIFVLVVVSYVWWCERQLPDGQEIHRVFFVGKSYRSLSCIIETKTQLRFAFRVHEFYDYVIPMFQILLSIECIGLFFALFHTRGIRKKLQPLNDLAAKAEAVSNMQFDSARLQSLTHAIENVSPDHMETKIATGDEDLRNIEIALNNLLMRMEDYKRQQARFVSDASHELRTPISVIQGYVEMLDRWGKEDPSVLEESIEALKQEAGHMNELIEQLLFLARGDSGRNTLHMVDLDLAEVMKEVWEESTMIDDKHRYNFELKGVEGDNAHMVGDVAMLKQSIRIFVQNAAKYSEPGNEIKLAVWREDNQISYVIQDEGIGMEQSDIAHIFERFYRSDVARNSSTGGTGLGLSIAKWIVDAHEGRIDVLSRPEFGTRFQVIFTAKSN